MKNRRNVVVYGSITGAALGLLGLASCSLGLDDSLIGRTPDAGGADTSFVDSPEPEGGDGALPPLNPEGGVCGKDEDCPTQTGCFTAKCDLPRKACVVQVCRQMACNSAACTAATSTCAAPQPYKYRAAQFPVGAPVGCGGALGRCFAAVYPFVFVGTPNGVLAFDASDPQSAAPTAVPITGLGFVPVQIVASGTRVYFLGTPIGTGPSSRLPIAYADVPADPFATKIAVTTVLGTYGRPATDPVVLFPRGSDTALLVDLNVTTAYGSTPIEPPLLEPAVFGSQGITFTATASPVAASGSRLLMGQFNGTTNVATFGFVSAAGSASPATGPDVPIATATPMTGPVYFTQSADGAVFWAHVALGPVPIDPNPRLIRAARGYFLVANDTGLIDPAAGIDLELYPGAPVGTQTVGPVALLDAKTALVTTSIPANPAQSNVGFVTAQPLAILKNSDGMPRRFPITVPVNGLAAAGSNGLGYVLAVDPALPSAPTVYVFDPACAP